MRSNRMFRFGRALAVSLLVHALLLGAPLPLSTGGEAGAAGPATSTLHATLDLIPEAIANSAHEDSPAENPAEPPALAAAPDKPQPASRGVPGSDDAIPLHGYYPAERLSRMPVAISTFDILPPAGGDTGLGGKMTVRIWISAKGVIDNVRVLSSDLPADYADAALAAFKKMRFEPGQIGGVPVQSWADIVIEYADFRR